MEELPQKRFSFLWLGENVVPRDPSGEQVFSRWVTHYGATNLLDAKKLLESYGIQFVIVPERLWTNNLKFMVTELQNIRSNSETVILWCTTSGKQLSEILDVIGVEDQEPEVRELVRKLAAIRYPLLSTDKRLLVERIAFLAAGRLDLLCCNRLDFSSLLRRSGQNRRDVQSLLLLNKRRIPFDAIAEDEETLLRWFDKGRAALAPIVLQVLKDPSIRRHFIRSMVDEVQNCYWVSTKSRLIASGQCDYGAWGSFSVERFKDKAMIAFFNAEALTNFSGSIGEDDPEFFSFFRWTSDYLDRYVPVDPNKKSRLAELSASARDFLEMHLCPALELMTARFHDSDSFENKNVALAPWGLFGLQVLLSAYLGCVAWHYGLSQALSEPRPVAFDPNGRFLRRGHTVLFEASRFLQELLKANKPRARAAGSGQ